MRRDEALLNTSSGEKAGSVSAVNPILMPFLEKRVRSVVTRRGATSKEVATSAGRIHVYDVPGNGTMPTVVILHGIAASGTGFAPLFMRLREHSKRVIIPDYPGHGFNKDPSVRLTIDTLFDAMTGALDELLGDEPFILVCNSLGGAVGVEYALKRSERVKALVLLSPAGAESSAEEWNALLGAFGLKNRKDSLAFMHRVYHRVPFIFRLIAHELPASIRRQAVADLFGSCSNERSVPANELAGLKMPILLLWGQSERLLPDSHFAWWKANLPPQTVVERPEGMGHCPHFDAPGRLAQRIVGFVRDHVTIPT